MKSYYQTQLKDIRWPTLGYLRLKQPRIQILVNILKCLMLIYQYVTFGEVATPGGDTCELHTCLNSVFV